MISFFKKDNFEHDRICVIDVFLTEPIYRNALIMHSSQTVL